MRRVYRENPMTANAFRTSLLPTVLLAMVVSAGERDANIIYEHQKSYRAVLERVYNYDLPGAEQIADSLIARNPEDGGPYFLLALVRWWHYLGESYSDSLGASFLQAAQKAVQVGEERIGAHADDPEALFFLGGSYGYLARYHLLASSWSDAYTYGRKSEAIFTKMLEADPTLYDADLAVGAYNYYADKLPGILKFFASVFGIGGDGKLGMAQLRMAADSGRYSGVEAEVLLGYINLQVENDYNLASRIFAGLSRRYPSNPIFRELLATSYRKAGKYDSAAAVCQEALSDSSVRYISSNQLAGMHSELAYTRMMSGRYDLAAKEYHTSSLLADTEYLRESPWIYFNSGLCEEFEKQYGAAKNNYRLVLKCRDYFGYHSLALKAIRRIQEKMEKGG